MPLLKRENISTYIPVRPSSTVREIPTLPGARRKKLDGETETERIERLRQEEEEYHQLYLLKTQEALEDLKQREFDNITIDRYDELIKSDEDRENIESILADYEYTKYTSHVAPTTISVAKMKELMSISGFYQRFRFFNYLFRVEVDRYKGEKKKLEKREIHLKKLSEEGPLEPGKFFDENNRPVYRKWCNSMFMRVTDVCMSQAHDYKKKNAALFGPKLVFDFSFDKEMSRREIFAVADQLSDAHGINYRSEGTYDIHFCNLQSDSETLDRLRKSIPNLLENPRHMITVHPESYLELFPRDQLVYLTPNAVEPYKWDVDDIPIIGALVDIQIKKNFSYSRAKREGLRMARLPLDEYLMWGSASKVLTLNQMMGIMCDIHASNGDWKNALLKNVPKRKLKTPEQLMQEDEYRRKKLSYQKKKFFQLDSVTIDYSGEIQLMKTRTVDKSCQPNLPIKHDPKNKRYKTRALLQTDQEDPSRQKMTHRQSNMRGHDSTDFSKLDSDVNETSISQPKIEKDAKMMSTQDILEKVMASVNKVK